MNIVALEIKNDVKETIEGLLETAERMNGVIIIGLNKDGTSFLRTSTMTDHEKAYLVKFIESWFMKRMMDGYEE